MSLSPEVCKQTKRNCRLDRFRRDGLQWPVMSRRHVWVAALLAAGLTVRLAYALMLPRKPPAKRPLGPRRLLRAGDFFFAFMGARGFRSRLTAMREPVYPIALGLAVKTLGRNYGAMLALHGLLSTLSLGLMFVLGRRLFGEAVAFPFGRGRLLSAVHLLLLPALRETMMVFLGLLSLWSVIKLNGRRKGALKGCNKFL